VETALGPERNHVIPADGRDGPDTARRRVLITGGGTGGHVYPGLAVAEALVEESPDLEVRFAGTSRGIESTLVPRAGYRLYRVPASGFRGMGIKARVLFLWNFLGGWLASLAILLRWRPDVVLGTGGYVSAPVMAAARTLGITCALQEQNAIPGSTNRLVGRWARRIYLGFGSASRYFAGDRCLETGNPVRGAFLDRPAGIGEPFAVKGKRILIFGGSRGAATLNAAVIAAAGAWRGRGDLDFTVQTGPGRAAEVEEAYRGVDPGRFRVLEFIDDMPSVLGGADLVVCRAGAMTLAELHCSGKPSILVPFPFATDDHQTMNAADCANQGAARLLPDDRCDGPTLTALVDELLADPATLDTMATAARRLARPDAARVIARDLLAMVEGKRPDPKEDDVP
jgi:UDP-N-acetylglucosamine--N-acetylmuramyl-(pentapeptide) pyrophosphoryl-undecaprenol N-acetylglucosamine transferase